MSIPLDGILNIGVTLIDRIWPDPTKANEAKLKLLELQQSGELAQLQADVQLAVGQQEINKVEAASQSLFVAGWRPFVGWVCGVSFAFKFVGGPLLVLVCAYLGHTITLPQFDYSEMSTILLGMLGLGALRTYEKTRPQ